MRPCGLNAYQRRTGAFSPGRAFRHFTTHCSEQISIPCGSAGYVDIDLFNYTRISPSTPLWIYLPSFPASHSSRETPPSFLQPWPVVRINYRWGHRPDSHSSEARPGIDHWPAPVHQSAIAYSWIVDNLAPRGREDIFVYGSHLGASLATSLALTETRPHVPFGVRGLIAYNGIYNWTMFLPEHRINKLSSKNPAISTLSEDNVYLQDLKSKLPALFKTPADLFDCFASPSLFFHRPGLLAPPSFCQSLEEAHSAHPLVGEHLLQESTAQPSRPLRKSHLIFPPRQSDLKIPPSLLLYDHDSCSAGKKRKTRISRHTLSAQTLELADLMRKSVEKVELAARKKWDEDVDGDRIDREVFARIKTLEINKEAENQDSGHYDVGSWLSEHCDKRGMEYNRQ